MSAWLVAIGAGIFGVLGTAHLLYTFFTPRFDPRDPAVRAAMEATSPRITGETTMWKAWVGFNASHSLGAIAFAAVYLVLCVRHPQLLADPLLPSMALFNGLAYLALARRYWFRIPFTGILVATIAFAVATFRAFL